MDFWDALYIVGFMFGLCWSFVLYICVTYGSYIYISSLSFRTYKEGCLLIISWATSRDLFRRQTVLVICSEKTTAKPNCFLNTGCTILNVYNVSYETWLNSPITSYVCFKISILLFQVMAVIYTMSKEVIRRTALL